MIGIRWPLIDVPNHVFQTARAVKHDKIAYNETFIFRRHVVYEQRVTRDNFFTCRHYLHVHGCSVSNVCDDDRNLYIEPLSG